MVTKLRRKGERDGEAQRYALGRTALLRRAKKDDEDDDKAAVRRRRNDDRMAQIKAQVARWRRRKVDLSIVAPFYKAAIAAGTTVVVAVVVGSGGCVCGVGGMGWWSTALFLHAYLPKE